MKVILIDDDKLIRLGWSMHCKKRNIELFSFKSIADFLSASSEYEKEIPIYIDSSLGDDIIGEVESRKIWDQGFQNLYLVTGHEKESIQMPFWIKDIFGKSPDLAIKNIHT